MKENNHKGINLTAFNRIRKQVIDMTLLSNTNTFLSSEY